MKQTKTSSPKILAIDIETKPITAYVWKLFDENIGLNQIIDAGGLLCVGAQWIGTRQKFFFSEWEDGMSKMLAGIHKLLSEADAVVTYNGDRFDLKKLNGEFLKNGLPPLGPITSIDVLKAVKKFGLISNRLSFVAPYLAVGNKLDTHGFDLWKQVMDGDERARRRMRLYCMRDVGVLISLYLRVRPFIINHPHLGDTKSKSCGVCGSKNVQSRGYRRTKAFKIQRLQCQDCGAWSDGSRTKV